MSGAIADQELMLEQQRLRSDTANAARAEEFRKGDEQVDRQEERIAHGSNIITPVIARKTARQRLIRARFTIYEFATDKVRMSVKMYDEDEWKKVSEGMYSHIAVQTKPGASGGQVPIKFTLSDSSAAEPAKYLKLAKRDGSVSTVRIKQQGAVGVGPMLKRDGGLDAFRFHRRREIV
jgi:hypothetical protein